MKIHLFVAHPDDEVIMCGGTIDRLIKHHHQVYVTYYSKNEEAYYNNETRKQRVKRALTEAKKSAKFFKFKAKFLNFKDMHLNQNKAKLIIETIKEIRRTNPDIIITHYSRDKHIDHRTLGEIVPEANFQSGCQLCGGKTTWKASLVLQGEVNLEMTTPFNYSLVLPFKKENLDKKINGFNIYSSVSTEHATETTWLNKKLKYCAELRGKSIDKKFGEAFIIDNYSPLSPEAFKILSKLT